MSSIHTVKELHGIIARLKQQNTHYQHDNQLLQEQISTLQMKNVERSGAPTTTTSSVYPTDHIEHRIATEEMLRDVVIFSQYQSAVESANSSQLDEALQLLAVERDTMIHECDEYRQLFRDLSKQIEEIRTACSKLQASGQV
eukprot:PhF_6_TR21690/c0_g1_i1/m.30971